MSSYDYGKPEVCAWIRRHFPPETTILDVGACDGKWRRLLPEYPNMDAVEAFEPNLTAAFSTATSAISATTGMT